MKEYIDKLKEIETIVELSIGTTMTEQKATDIYQITNELMTKVKKLNIHSVSGKRPTANEIHEASKNYSKGLPKSEVGFCIDDFEAGAEWALNYRAACATAKGEERKD